VKIASKSFFALQPHTATDKEQGAYAPFETHFWTIRLMLQAALAGAGDEAHELQD
jgi:hypothetical protein